MCESLLMLIPFPIIRLVTELVLLSREALYTKGSLNLKNWARQEKAHAGPSGDESFSLVN